MACATSLWPGTVAIGAMLPLLTWRGAALLEASAR